MSEQGKLMSLERWARAQFGEDVPHRNTLQRWAREGKILPVPQKVGRSYMVEVDAVYVRDYHNAPARIHVSA